MDSSTWWRPSSPVFAFFQRFSWGNTHCQRHSREALGYLRCSASGNGTKIRERMPLYGIPHLSYLSINLSGKGTDFLLRHWLYPLPQGVLKKRWSRVQPFQPDVSHCENVYTALPINSMYVRCLYYNDVLVTRAVAVPSTLVSVDTTQYLNGYRSSEYSWMLILSLFCLSFVYSIQE